MQQIKSDTVNSSFNAFVNKQLNIFSQNLESSWKEKSFSLISLMDETIAQKKDHLFTLYAAATMRG